MKRLAVALIALAIAVPIGGCGTVCNLASGEPTVYGGIAQDCAWLQHFSLGMSPTPGTDARGVLLVLGLFAMEPLLSFTADTAMLPLTMWLEDKRYAGYAP